MQGFDFSHNREMRQCLRCKKQCAAPAFFCEQCRLSFQADDAQENRLSPHNGLSSFSSSTNHQDDFARRESATTPSLTAAPPYPLFAGHSEHGMSPFDQQMFQEIDAAGFFPEEPRDDSKNIFAVSANSVDQSFNRLNEAAQHIAADSENPANARAPHVPRLAPIRHISVNVERASTPLPASLPEFQYKYPQTQEPPLPKNAYSTEPGERNALTDDSPLFPDSEFDFDDYDPWQEESQHDPLGLRHMPKRSEVDADTLKNDVTAQPSQTSKRRVHPFFSHLQRWLKRRTRVLFIVLIVLALIAIVFDGLLVAFWQHHLPGTASNLPPALMLSTSFVEYGQHVTIRLRNFTPNASVVLSRDIQEPVDLTTQSSPFVKLDANGARDLMMIVGNDWQPGQHTIEAEDVHSHYTASATLRLDEGPTRPAHLLLGTTTINLGSGYIGANTLRALHLSNGGGGDITWSASSNQPWLMLSPNHGTFSEDQGIQVAGDRTSLKAGVYHGNLKFTSNVSNPIIIPVQMTILPLPPGVGAVLDVTPAVLNFTATDGMGNPASQSLTVSNPGKKPLSYSISSVEPANLSNGPAYLTTTELITSWLNPGQSSGTVIPGTSSTVPINIDSKTLLPGTYISNLVISASSGTSALNSPQEVSVALIVQPSCGVTLSSSTMSFTTVAGQVSPSNQALSLTTTASCPSVTSWSTVSSASWLTATPTNGQVQGATPAVTSIGVSSASMKSGVYNGILLVSVAQNTQSLMVQLTVQSPPPPSAPVMKVSPLNLNFSTTLGQSGAPAQTVSVANTGPSTLVWSTAVSNSTGASWLTTSPTSGTVAPQQVGNTVVNVSTNGLTPGVYSAQLVIIGKNQAGATASDSPQTINVTFTVAMPCTISTLSSNTLSFSAVQGGNNPSPSQVSFTASGNCNWPLKWNAAANTSATWLNFSPSSGSLSTSGQSATITVTPTIAGQVPGVYSVPITVTTSDFTGAAVGTSQTVTSTLTVLQPCTLQTATSSLSFSASQGQSSSAQTIQLGEVGGNCADPVSWTASPGSTTWLSLSPSAGSDNGSGESISVTADATNLTPGTYSATISLSATGSGGAPVLGNPQIAITFKVNGATVNGEVEVCSSNPCLLPSALPNAALTLTDPSGNVVYQGAADSTGSFTITNLAANTYTLAVSGTDASGIAYTGSQTVNIASGGSSTNAPIIVLATPVPSATPTPVPTQ